MPATKRLSSAPAPAASSDTQLAELTEAVQALTAEVRMIGNILERLQDDFAWALSNDKFRCRGPRHVMHITSMPKDPTAPGFGKRVNNYTPANAPEAFTTPPAAPEPTTEKHSGQLF